MFPDLDIIRKEATARLDQSKRGALGQFLTPVRVGKFMASFFDGLGDEAHLLEAGAGVGTLVASFMDKAEQADRVRITAYEIDPILVGYLITNLEHYRSERKSAGNETTYEVRSQDFIPDAAYRVALGERLYSHALLNPPYKKLHSESAHRQSLRSIGQEHVNLYTAFVSLALAQLQLNGELVAIIPRSFCNGLYYKPFRKFIFGRAALLRLHLFRSRTSAFKDDEVLQENIIIHLKRGALQGQVIISQSNDQTLEDIEQKTFDFDQIVWPRDSEGFIHIPHLVEHLPHTDKTSSTLKVLGIDISTGPIVDYRVKEHLRQEPEPGTAPLLYPVHFNGKGLAWPTVSRKPNAIAINATTRNSLWPKGYYVLVRRFSSKEEKQRIVARVVDPEQITDAFLGIENHLNVFHIKKKGLPADLAYGLATYLNSTFVDQYFRTFNGHTQVNATDLKRITYPTLEDLKRLGKEADSLKDFSIEKVDELVAKYI